MVIFLIHLHIQFISKIPCYEIYFQNISRTYLFLTVFPAVTLAQVIGSDS